MGNIPSHPFEKMKTLDKLLVWSESVDGMVRLLDAIQESINQSSQAGTALIRHLEESLQRKNDQDPGAGKLKQAWVDSGKRLGHIGGMLEYFTNLLKPRDLRIEPIDIKGLFQEAIAPFKPTIDEKRIALDINVNNGEELLRTDRFFLNHALMNLIHNAVYFTPSDGVVNLFSTEEPEPAKLITVSDSGPGIPEDLHETVFRPFYSTKIIDAFGCGLGLPMAKLLLHRIQGSLALDGEYKKGARFTVRIPAGPSQ